MSGRPASEKRVPIGEAAQALGVSVDTIRRWDRAGQIRIERDASNRRLVPESEITRLGRRTPTRTGSSMSARNRFEGVVVSVEVSGLIAQVEIEAGPHRVVSIITADAVAELGLAPGVSAVATVKATSVMIARD